MGKRKSGIKALNDFYVIEEDPIEATVDTASGLTQEVVNALTSKKLFMPDQGKYYLEKFPFRGTVIAKGDKLKYDIPLSSKVMFARLGGQRWVENDKQYISIRERDIHAIIS